MARKVYFTEEQLKNIIGEDIMNGGGYLDKTSTGDEYPTDSLPATDSEVIMTEPGGISRTTDAYASQKIRDNMWMRRGSGYSLYESGKKKVVKNDEGKVVPETCPKCGSKVGVYIQGEPVYLCSNKKCNEYFGTVPFSKHLEKEMEEMDKEIAKREKHLNERNAELDGKDIFTLPKELRAFATPDGVHDDIMARLRNGEAMNLPSLYRMRNELADSENIKIKRAIDTLIKQAQQQGESLRNTHPVQQSKNTQKTKIYYERS